MELTDEKVMKAIGNILRPEMIEIVIAGIRAEMENASAADPRLPLVAEIEALDGQIGNLTDAIAMGGNLAALAQRLKGLEERRQRP